jgi:dTDP-glucose 4,6-dehydratase
MVITLVGGGSRMNLAKCWEMPRMTKMLVTGGAGFIGANFVHYWLNEHPDGRLVVVDALTYAGNLSSLHSLRSWKGFRFVHGNICDSELVERILREEQIDVIVHFAAESHVDRSVRGPDTFIETNVIGTHTLLKAARSAWVPEFSLFGVQGSLGPPCSVLRRHVRP